MARTHVVLGFEAIASFLVVSWQKQFAFLFSKSSMMTCPTPGLMGEMAEKVCEQLN